MSFLLDVNFYNKLPIWVYISTGFGVLFILNTCCLCCYSCKYKKKLEKLKIKEYEIERREISLEKLIESERKRLEREREYDGIVLTKPTLYSELEYPSII